MLTELPDGSLVAAVPQCGKTGLSRGRSYWGSGGSSASGGSGGGQQSWGEALTALRAHWPGARPEEEARADGSAGA